MIPPIVDSITYSSVFMWISHLYSAPLWTKNKLHNSMLKFNFRSCWPPSSSPTLSVSWWPSVSSRCPSWSLCLPTSSLSPSQWRRSARKLHSDSTPDLLCHKEPKEAFLAFLVHYERRIGGLHARSCVFIDSFKRNAWCPKALGA